MQVEEQQEVIAPTPEEEAAAEAAFAAGFAGARGDAPPTDEPVAQAAPQAAPEPDQAAPAGEQVVAAPADPAEPVAQAEAQPDDENAPVAVSKKDFARLMLLAETVPALQDELRSTRDKAFGRIGSIQQMVDAVKAQAGAGKTFSVPQLKRLREEYGDLADILAEDLGEAFAQPAAPVVDATVDDTKASGDAPGAEVEFDPFADPRVQERQQQLETAVRESHIALVDTRHPDWRDLTKTTEFAEWRNNLPAPAQQMLATSWDASVLTDAFSDFKSWRDKRNASASASKQRDNRLANAIPATTGRATGAHVVDEDAEFAKGFAKARGNR